MKLGAVKPQSTGSTPELRLTHAGTGVPVLQEPSILQHLNAVYAGYGGGINDALCRLPVTSPAGKRSRQKRRRICMGGIQPLSQQQEDEDDDDPTLQMRGNDSKRRTADVQFDAGHYLEQLAYYTEDIRLPPPSDLLRLETIIQRNSLHDNEQPAQHAFRLLLSYIQRFPATQLRQFPAESPYAGMPYIEERSNAWILLGRKRRLVQTEDQEEDDTLMNPDQFFFQLWEGAAELAQDVESPANIAEHYGQVLLLRAVVAQLQAELVPRLAAFRGTSGPAAAAKAAAGETGKAAASRRDGLLRNRRRLLEESHLWRLLAEVPIKGIRSRHELVGTLLAIIGASADTPEAGEVSGESPRLVTVQLLAGLAATMLRMLLELYGTAEASGYYSDAAGRIREHDRRNHRILLDTFLLEGFIGTDAVLRGWEQKQALLVALRPRDRLRLLGLVMAKRRVQRGEADARKYGSMHAARELVHGTGDTPSFVDVDPVQVLTYIADDLGFAQSAVNKSANELVLVAAQVARAAAVLRPDAAAEVAAALERMSSAMLARYGDNEKANRLSANSRAELQSVAMLLQAAAAPQ